MNKLAEINASKAEEIKRLEPHAAELRKQALLRNDFRPFRTALQLPDGVAIIAEVKKASPSAGIIAPDFNPLSQAREYARGGAHALSVLTDEKYFHGHLSYLKQIREQVDLPLLRKDFIFHPYQVYEARAAGADCILLILAMLKEGELRSLAALVREVKMAALIEVHNPEELALATRINADLIGINNRDLHTFVTDLAVTEKLLANYRGDALIVAESGINAPEDIRRLDAVGARAFLIGESLLRDGNPAAKLPDLLRALDGGASQ